MDTSRGSSQKHAVGPSARTALSGGSVFRNSGSPSFFLPVLAGLLTVGAGLVHATAAGTHQGDETVVVLFALTAVAQVLLGLTVATRPGRLTLVALAGVNVVVFVAWLASRTTGLPLIDSMAEPEAIGLQDATAMVLGLVGAVAAVVALVQHAEARPPSFSPLWGLAILPALLGMVAPHGHSGSHGDGHGAEAAGLAADPIFSGADASKASEAQLEAAKELIQTTRDSVRVRFPHKDALKAAGYHSIGDGFPLTSHEHFVNDAYLSDGRELDPERIESIVVEGGGNDARVVSAMYILETGKTMADIPDIAGELTTWHDHQDLCWDETGTRLRGVLSGGRCVPGGTFRPTAPMLHVWLEGHQCGPFAGLEGHGAAECGPHTH